MWCLVFATAKRGLSPTKDGPLFFGVSPLSIYVSSEVWAHSKATGAQLLVLLALADRARSEDAVCWPGVESVAKMARISRRQAMRHIEYLIARGEVRRIEKGGHGLGDTNTYQIILGKYQGVTYDTLQGVIQGKKGDIRRRPRVSRMTPEPSVNRQEPRVVFDEKKGRYKTEGTP